MPNFGPLEPLLADPDVLEIMINRYDQIYVERRGRMDQIPPEQCFRDNDHLMGILQDELVTPTGRTLNESQPILDLRLPDGSRCHIVIPPIAMTGISVVIRKFARFPMTGEKLLEFGALTQPMLDFLQACVRARMNIAVSGSTGSGKTTLLNVITGFSDPGDRLVVVENDAELRLNLPHQVVLETRPPNLEGRGEITAQELVRSAMKMRPDRIILGEARGGEMLEILQAMNTGYDGTMFSLHANSGRDALTRLEMMVTMGMPQVPIMSVRQQFATGLHLIVHMERLMGGTRRMMKISEVIGLRDGVLMTQDLYEFMQTGFENGHVTGVFRALGVIPAHIERIQGSGIDLPLEMFRR